MSDREIFPIPTSGQTIIAKTGPQTFEVTCSGMNAIDHAQLPGFFAACKAGLGHSALFAALLFIPTVASIPIPQISFRMGRITTASHCPSRFLWNSGPWRH
jgi:hypothetical protein